MSNIIATKPVWDQQAAALKEPAADWLWHGFLARGNLTLLTSEWKAGKTTLLSMLLARRKAGGTVAGLQVQPGKTVVVSEEPLSLWGERARRYDFGGQVCFFSQPFRTIPGPDDWQYLLDQILVLRHDHGIDLAVIDPLAPFCRGENQSRTMFETLLPLRALQRERMAVMVLHHPGKGEKPIGQSARGSSALLGHVDISIEMHRPSGDPFSRRRHFVSSSRHSGTPRQLVLELSADATDYLPLPPAPEEDLPPCWPILCMVLEDAPQKLTRNEILDDWPPDYEKPNRTTLWRCLDRALARAIIAVEGTGRKYSPFRYWLPAREAVWKQDPLYELREEQRRLLSIPPEAIDPVAFQHQMRAFQSRS